MPTTIPLTPTPYAMPEFDECQPPCWLGIDVGASTADEALDQLRRYFGAENLTVEPDEYLDDIHWRINNHPYITNGTFSIHDENIVWLLRVGFVDDTITLQSMMEVLGHPSYIHGFSTGCDSPVYLTSHLAVYTSSENGRTFASTQFVYGFDLSSDSRFMNPYFVYPENFFIEWEGFDKDYPCDY
jgi:hypothetical protein